MKKIIAALFAVAFAYGAQAAAVNWDFYGYYEDVNGELLEGTVKVYLDDVLLSTMDIVNGEAQDSFNVDVGTLKTVAEITNFSDGAGKLEYTYVISSLPLAGYPDVDSSLMAINSDVNDNITQYASIDLSAGTEANGYTPEAIPEPTTGLLVLLGVVGLALRRRRA